MSNQQKQYSYHYLTLTGDGDAHQLVKDYHLNHVDAWNQGEVGQDRYQFQKMCIRLHRPQDENIYENEAIERFFSWPQQRQLLLIPPQYERTLHLVSHGENFQSHGFHLSARNIELLAQHQANFHFYDYQQVDDGHDFPFSTILPLAEDEKSTNEYAYFVIDSTGHTIEQLAVITGLLPNVIDSKNMGDIQFSRRLLTEGQQPRRWSSTRFHVNSGIEQGQPLALHIKAILSQLEPIYERFIPLLLDFRVTCWLVGTGSFCMPYQLSLSKEWILQLAQFKCAVDMDLYGQ